MASTATGRRTNEPVPVQRGQLAVQTNYSAKMAELAKAWSQFGDLKEPICKTGAHLAASPAAGTSRREVSVRSLPVSKQLDVLRPVVDSSQNQRPRMTLHDLSCSDNSTSCERRDRVKDSHVKVANYRQTSNEASIFSMNMKTDECRQERDERMPLIIPAMTEAKANPDEGKQQKRVVRKRSSNEGSRVRKTLRAEKPVDGATRKNELQSRRTGRESEEKSFVPLAQLTCPTSPHRMDDSKLAQLRDVVKRQRESPSSHERKLLRPTTTVASRQKAGTTEASHVTHSHHKECDPVTVSHSVEFIPASDTHKMRKRKVASAPSAPSYRGFNTTHTLARTAVSSAFDGMITSHAGSWREPGRPVKGQVVNDSKSIVRSRECDLKRFFETSAAKAKGTIRKTHSGHEGKPKRPNLITPSTWREGQALVNRVLGKERKGKKRKDRETVEYSPPTRDRDKGDQQNLDDDAVELSQHSMETATDDGMAASGRGDDVLGVGDISSEKLSHNTATLLLELQAPEGDYKDEDASENRDESKAFVAAKRRKAERGGHPVASARSQDVVYPNTKVRHYDLDEVKRYMARQLAARRQKEREARSAQQQKQEQTQQRLQQLYEYQRRHVAACVPSYRRMKMKSTFSVRQVNEVHVHEDSDKENMDITGEWQRHRRTMTSLSRVIREEIPTHDLQGDTSSVGSNDKSMTEEDNDDEEERRQGSSILRPGRCGGNENRDTDQHCPQQQETNILPEVMQVDVNESEETLKDEVVRPAMPSSVQAEGQPSRLHTLHQSALSLTERIEQETRRLRKAGMLNEMKDRALALAGRRTQSHGNRDSTFRSEALPGVMSLNKHRPLNEQQQLKTVRVGHERQHVEDASCTSRLSESVAVKQTMGSDMATKRDIRLPEGDDNLPEMSETDAGDSLSTMSTQSLLQSRMEMRHSPMSRQDVIQPMFSATFQGDHLSSELAGRLPWELHVGDPYSVINIFTRRQAKNMTTQHRQSEEWKYDDDFSEFSSSKSDVQRAVTGDGEHVMSDKSGSDVDFTNSLIANTTEETVSVKQEERQVEKEEVTGQDAIAFEDAEQDALLSHQHHSQSESDVSMSPQFHPTDSAAAGGLAMEYEMSSGDYQKLHTDITSPQDRFSPDALGRHFATELHLLDSIDESMHQLGALERAHAVSLAQQETVSLSQLLKGRQEQHQQEMDRLAQRVKDDIAAVEKRLTTECSAMREESLQTRGEITSVQRSAQEAAKASTESQTEILQQVENMQRELDQARLVSATSVAQPDQLPPAPSSLAISTVTAAVSAAVDSVMKSRDDRVVKRQERATMTSEQDNSVTSSECESTSTVSLRTASLVREDDHSEMEDLTKSVTDTSRRQSTLLRSEPASSRKLPFSSQDETHTSSVSSHTAVQHGVFSPTATGSRSEQRYTAERTPLPDESRQVITSGAITKSQNDSTAADIVSSVQTDLTPLTSLIPQEKSTTTRRDIGSPAVSYSMQFDETEVTGTAEEMETESQKELDEQSFRLLLPSESHRRRQEVDVAMTASRLTSASSATESQDEVIVASHGTTSPFSGEDSFDHFTARMAHQLLQDEEMRAQHQAALLRLREKALGEKTKAELAWLKHKEQRLRDKGEDEKMPPIKRRRKEILSKLHTERSEIKRLKAANKAASDERRMLLLQQKEIVKIHETTKFYLSRLKREVPHKAHQLADLSVSLGESPTSPTMDGEVSEATDHDASEIIEDIRTASPSSSGGQHMQENAARSHTTNQSQQVSGMENSADSQVQLQRVSHMDITSSSVAEPVMSNSMRPQSTVTSASNQPHTNALHSLLTSTHSPQVRDLQATSPSGRVSLSESNARTLPLRSVHVLDSESHLRSPTQLSTEQGSVPMVKSLTPSITSPTSSDNEVMKSLRRLEVQSSERYLTKREQKLRKRRQQAHRILKSRKELLEWQDRLDKEEAELRRMVDEAMGLEIRRQRPRVDGSRQAAVTTTTSEAVLLNSSLVAVSSRHEVVSVPPSDVEAVGDHEESSIATVIDDESVGTDYGSETFESLDKTLTTQQDTTTLTLARQRGNTPTAAEIVKETDESRTETTEKRRMTNDIENRIQLLKVVLRQRKAEAKKLYKEKKQRKQALLEEQEARLRREIETVEQTISKQKEELQRPLPLLPDSHESMTQVSLLAKTNEKEREADDQDIQQTAEQLGESMKTPALHELSTYSTFSGKENSAHSQPQAYSGSTFISSSLTHTQVEIEMRDEEQSEKSDECRQNDTSPTDASFVALRVEQRSSPPVDDQQHVSMPLPALPEQQTSLSKTYTLAFESSMTSSTPKRQPLTSVSSPSLFENGKSPQNEVTYSDTFIPSAQSLDSAINVRPLEDIVVVAAVSSPPISVGGKGNENMSVPEITEGQIESSVLQVGDRVLVDGNRAGVLQFWGTTHFASGVWAGVELDLPRGSHDGEWEGQRYFLCADHHGIFVASHKVQLLGGTIDKIESNRTKSPLNVSSSHSDIVTSTQTSRKVDAAVSLDRGQSGHDEDVVVDKQPEGTPSVEESGSDITPLADDDSELLRIISSAAEAVESFRRSLSPSVATDQDSASLGESENLVVTDIQRPVTLEIPAGSDEIEQQPEEISLTEEQITSLARTEIESEVSRVTVLVVDQLVTDSLNVMLHVANDKERKRTETKTVDYTATLHEEVQYKDKKARVLWEEVVDQLLTFLLDEAVQEIQPLVEKRAAEHKCYHITRHADDEDTSLDNSSISMSSGISDLEPRILSPDYDTKFPTIIIESREELQKASVSSEPAEVPLFIPYDRETICHVVKSSLCKEEPQSMGDEHQMAFLELLTDSVHEVSQQLLPMETDKDKSVRVLWRKPRRYHGTEVRRLKTSRRASDLDGLMGLVEDELCALLGLHDQTEQSRNVALASCQGSVSRSQGGQTNRKTIEAILVEELREEESQWIDYDDDETQVKFRLADEILDTLLQETAIVVQGVQNEKIARREARE